MERINQEDFPKNTEPQKNIEPSELKREETKEEKIEKLRILHGLTSITHTFENWKHLPGTEKAYKAFKDMAEGKSRPMLLVCGGLGNGKTFLCEALSIALYRRGERCPVNLWSELRRQLLQAMHRPKPGRMDYDTLFENIRRRKRLIIDDVGMGSKGTEWEMAELEDIINYRYRERLFTVMTTNRALEELPDRVVSRFFDSEVSQVVINEGKDYRIRQI